MARKTVLTAAVLAVALALAGGEAAQAAYAGYSSTIDSGGAISHFTNQRTSSQLVTNYLDVGQGGVTQGLNGCSNFTNLVTDINFTAPSHATYGPGSKNVCFRLHMSRTFPADTNGWLPGSGTTSVSGEIVY